MKNIDRFKVLSIFVVLAFVLAACGGTLPQTKTSLKGPKAEANTIIAFKGVVEAINGTEWTVNGQKITLDPQASPDPMIGMGDEVNVEAHVSADGAVVAVKVESSGMDNTVSTPSVDDNSTPEPVETPSTDVNHSPDDSVSQAPGASENEVVGTVEALTADTITINGVTYNLTNFTEVKDALTIGDTVKLHVTVNTDGTATVREIEKSVASVENKSGSSSGADNGSHYHTNHDKRGGKGNSSNDGSNHNSNDKHGGSGNGGSGGG